MRFLKITSILLLALVLSSCEDVLNNAQPSTSIEQEQALNSAGAVDAIRASMYNRLQLFEYSTEYMLGPDALADNLINREGSNRFMGMTENSDGSGMDSWVGSVSSNASSYEIINDANLILNGIEEGVLDESTLGQYQGEAYAIRALAYHHLARTFGYEPGMSPPSGPGAGFDLGVPEVTSPTLTDDDINYMPRSTVASNYELIISDLENAINLLSNGDAGNKQFITLAAAQALMARVQLYAGNNQAAEDYSAQALASSDAELVSGDAVGTMFDENAGLNPEALFEVAVDPSTEGVLEPQNNSLAVYTAQQWVAQVPTQDIMDLYSDDDARLAWFGPCYDELAGEDAPGCPATHPAVANGEEGLEIQKWAAERGQYLDNIPHFRVAELLLIQAEARLNGASGDAAAPLNELREARGLQALNSVTIDDVLEERRRELVAEGHRFFDLKRLGMTIRKAPETLNTNRQPVPYTDYRILDNIPYNEVSLSEANATSEDSVLVQNPGY